MPHAGSSLKRVSENSEDFININGGHVLNAITMHVPVAVTGHAISKRKINGCPTYDSN
jgi:hypothetical protein